MIEWVEENTTVCVFWTYILAFESHAAINCIW